MCNQQQHPKTSGIFLRTLSRIPSITQYLLYHTAPLRLCFEDTRSKIKTVRGPLPICQTKKYAHAYVVGVLKAKREQNRHHN